MTTAQGVFLISVFNILLLCMYGRWSIDLHWIPAVTALITASVAWIFVCDAIPDEPESTVD